MIGSIIGDVIGSVFEWEPVTNQSFDLFNEKSIYTDDSILTIATAQAILTDGDYAKHYREIGRKYDHPNAGYGGKFRLWLFSETMGPYGSFGNGSAMRVAPIGYAFDDMTIALQEAKRSADVTHNHPKGVKGAQATVMAILMARQGCTKEQIREEISRNFGYDLTRTCENIRPLYTFDVTCQGSVPEAIIAFLDSDSYEDAVRKAISLGGDADTQACIAGGIAQAFYKNIPKEIIVKATSVIPEGLIKIINEFNIKFRVIF
jgi:ADP-ribosylglycohydrolase